MSEMEDYDESSSEAEANRGTNDPQPGAGYNPGEIDPEEYTKVLQREEMERIAAMAKKNRLQNLMRGNSSNNDVAVINNGMANNEAKYDVDPNSPRVPRVMRKNKGNASANSNYSNYNNNAIINRNNSNLSANSAYRNSGIIHRNNNNNNLNVENGGLESILVQILSKLEELSTKVDRLSAAKSGSSGGSGGSSNVISSNIGNTSDGYNNGGTKDGQFKAKELALSNVILSLFDANRANEYIDIIIKKEGFDDIETLCQLKENDLKEIGISKKGHRMKFLNYFQKYKEKNMNSKKTKK